MFLSEERRQWRGCPMKKKLKIEVHPLVPEELAAKLRQIFERFFEEVESRGLSLRDLPEPIFEGKVGDVTYVFAREPAGWEEKASPERGKRRRGGRRN